MCTQCTPPLRTRLRTVERERCEIGFRTWAEAKSIAIDRKTWKYTINSCELGKKRREIHQVSWIRITWALN